MTPRFLADDLAIGATPSAAAMKDLARKFAAIVDLRMPGEIGDLTIAEEQRLLDRARVTLLAIGVPARTVPAEQIDQFRREVAALPKPVFVHCTKGARAALFSCIHLGIEVDEAEDAIMARIRDAGVVDDADAYEDLVRDYVSRARQPYTRLEQVIW